MKINYFAQRGVGLDVARGAHRWIGEAGAEAQGHHQALSVAGHRAHGFVVEAEERLAAGNFVRGFDGDAWPSVRVSQSSIRAGKRFEGEVKGFEQGRGGGFLVLGGIDD